MRILFIVQFSWLFTRFLKLVIPKWTRLKRSARQCKCNGCEIPERLCVAGGYAAKGGCSGHSLFQLVLLWNFVHLPVHHIYPEFMIFKTASDSFFCCCATCIELILKNLVKFEKSLKQWIKWAQSQPPSSNCLKMVASQRQNWQY